MDFSICILYLVQIVYLLANYYIAICNYLTTTQSVFISDVLAGRVTDCNVNAFWCRGTTTEEKRRREEVLLI